MEKPKAVLIQELIDTQKKKFAAAKTSNGLVFFKLIGRMIRDKDIKPPKGLNETHLQEAYDQAAILVGEREYAKSIKKNRENENRN
jgi:hypothetical protein